MHKLQSVMFTLAGVAAGDRQNTHNADNGKTKHKKKVLCIKDVPPASLSPTFQPSVQTGLT